MMRIALAILVTAFVVPAWSADGEFPTLTVNAAGVVELPAQHLDVILTVHASGADAQAALTALSDLAGKVAAKLSEDTGVPIDQIKRDPPELTDKSEQQRMLSRVRMMRSGNRLQKKKEEEAPRVDVHLTLRARVTLAETDPATVLVKSEGLKKKVNEGAVKATEGPPKADGEKEEVSDEERMMMNNWGEEQANQGPVRFVYHADLTEEARQKAMGDAIKNAVATANRTAKVMGKGGAEVRSVIVNSDGSQEAQYYARRYGYGYGGMPQPENSQDGVFGATPKLSLGANIAVTFAIK